MTGGRHPLDSLRRLDGSTVPGGCEHCDAYQTVSAPVGHPNVARITVHHEDDCPWYTRRAPKQEGGIS